MEINVQPNEVDKIADFIAAIIVNKGSFWSLHMKRSLDDLRSKGIAYWADSQKKPLSKYWAKKKAENGWPAEVNVATGQTKEQALFLTGSGEMYSDGRFINSSIKAAPWVPNASKGSPPWRGTKDNRPFYRINTYKRRLFWRPAYTRQSGETTYGYVDLKSADHEIWRDGQTSNLILEEAGNLLILKQSDALAVLKGKRHSLGQWKQGSNSGPAASWR